jgi:hypothetical protein
MLMPPAVSMSASAPWSRNLAAWGIAKLENKRMAGRLGMVLTVCCGLGFEFLFSLYRNGFLLGMSKWDKWDPLPHLYPSTIPLILRK